MMGRRRIAALWKRVQELAIDGHREAGEMEELLQEVERLCSREWTPERLADALDTLTALYLMSPAVEASGLRKTLGNTTVLELIEWSGRELRPQGGDRSTIEAMNQRLHECLMALGVRGGWQGDGGSSS
jgi:hypothetical protein